MPPMSKVDLHAALRRDSRAGLSNRALHHKYGVGFRTVRKTRLDPYKGLVDQMLRADPTAPRKQQHTAKRVFDRLVAEYGAVDLAYGLVRAYVAERRDEIRIAAGRGIAKAFVPQSHRPGAEAEVGFGDVTIRLAGQQVKCSLFSFRLSYSGKAVHRVSASGGQEAFFEGHVHAFSVLAGVPTGRVRCDNLNSAVAQVLGFDRARVETERWTAFRVGVHIEVPGQVRANVVTTSRTMALPGPTLAAGRAEPIALWLRSHGRIGQVENTGESSCDGSAVVRHVLGCPVGA
ncbi:hypothetical protein [Streptomyces phaeolivaceus]|uniref:hypothetical protein n=1 Tax=Streptomyces phaeolivaceus TaxID=2653200 RepID=UPI001D03AFE7|nr:hypothetical protein [Streptomyces phaeolivaceus]